jgi:hypothetical protein
MILIASRDDAWSVACFGYGRDGRGSDTVW